MDALDARSSSSGSVSKAATAHAETGSNQITEARLEQVAPEVGGPAAADGQPSNILMGSGQPALERPAAPDFGAPPGAEAPLETLVRRPQFFGTRRRICAQMPPSPASLHKRCVRGSRMLAAG